MEVFDYDPSAPWLEEKDKECPECGEPNSTGGYCSESCFNASML